MKIQQSIVQISLLKLLLKSTSKCQVDRNTKEKAKVWFVLFCSISYLLVARKCNPLIHLEWNTFVLILFSSRAVVCFTVAAFTFPYEAFSKVSISISRGQGVHDMFRWQARASEECHCYRWDQSAAFYCNCGVQPVEVEVWFFGVASQKLWTTLRAPRGLDRVFLKGAEGINCVTRGTCHIVTSSSTLCFH